VLRAPSCRIVRFASRYFVMFNFTNQELGIRETIREENKYNDVRDFKR